MGDISELLSKSPDSNIADANLAFSPRDTYYREDMNGSEIAEIEYLERERNGEAVLNASESMSTVAASHGPTSSETPLRSLDKKSSVRISRELIEKSPLMPSLVDPLNESTTCLETTNSTFELLAGLDDLKKTRETKMTVAKEKYFKVVTRPYACIVIITIQLSLLIYSFFLNERIVGRYIEPWSLNPTIGPSMFTLIQMGAKYPPCIKSYDIFPDNATYPCPYYLARQITDSTQTCHLDDICGLGGAHQPWQSFRFLMAIFLHSGILHFLLNLTFHVGTMVKLEGNIGTLRFLSIYFSCGIAGFLFGALFASPVLPSVGASGSCFGVIGCILVDIFMNWRLTEQPKRQLIQIFILVTMTFILGLLPQIDNFAHIGGFGMGLVANLALMPTISFGNRNKAWKKSLRYIFIPLMIFIFVAMIVGFALNDASSFCPWCKYLDCIPGLLNCDMLLQPM